jgi:cysteine desulfurase
MSIVPVEKAGFVSPKAVQEAITDKTQLIAIMAANNETGVKNDIEAIAQIAAAHKIPLLVDGVALCGKEVFTIPRGVTFFVVSSHKIHGPVGAAALFIRKGAKLLPLITGGGQERGLRAGTENVAAIVGFAAAVSILQQEQEAITGHLKLLQSYFESQLEKELPFIQVNGKEADRLASTSNILFRGIDGEELLFALDREKIAASLGSACASGGLTASRVLLAMGLSQQEAISSIRFSFSRMNTLAELQRAIEVICRLKL